jgi:hypothetical protein
MIDGNRSAGSAQRDDGYHDRDDTRCRLYPLSERTKL